MFCRLVLKLWDWMKCEWAPDWVSSSFSSLQLSTWKIEACCSASLEHYDSPMLRKVIRFIRKSPLFKNQHGLSSNLCFKTKLLVTCTVLPLLSSELPAPDKDSPSAVTNQLLCMLSDLIFIFMCGVFLPTGGSIVSYQMSLLLVQYIESNVGSI